MRRVGIFTKMDMAGGSEFRAVEMANAVSHIPGYQGVLMVEKSVPAKLRSAIDPLVEVHEGIFDAPDLDALYSVDHLLVINSDSRLFTTEAYWLGASPRHPFKVDLSRIRQMTFLFNFIVSPSSSLPTLQRHVRDIRIITANSKFFDEIGKQDRYDGVRHYPRLQLESPIHPRVAIAKVPSDRLRFGMHSLPASSKWNDQFPDLIHRVNERFGDRVLWDFMGIPVAMRAQIRDGNAVFRKEFSTPVGDFLSGIDVFVFFLSWKREEPWARSSAEALMSGCPVITTARGGNKNQIIHGNTGFLCRTLDDFVHACCKLIEEASLVGLMRQNALRSAQHFRADVVAQRFLDFIR